MVGNKDTEIVMATTISGLRIAKLLSIDPEASSSGYCLLHPAGNRGL